MGGSGRERVAAEQQETAQVKKGEQKNNKRQLR
jgi:hypothetical protein